MKDSLEMQAYMQVPLKNLHRRYNHIRHNYYLFGFIPIRDKLRTSDERKLKKILDETYSFSASYSQLHPERVEMNTAAVHLSMSIREFIRKLK